MSLPQHTHTVSHIHTVTHGCRVIETKQSPTGILTVMSPALTHTQGKAQQRPSHSHTAHTSRSSLGLTHRPLCSLRVPKVLPPAPTPAPPHTCSPHQGRQDRGLTGRGASTGGLARRPTAKRGSPTRREASEKGCHGNRLPQNQPEASILGSYF